MTDNNVNKTALHIIIPNELAMIYPIQQTAKAYARVVGFETKECYHIELLLEEFLTNIIKYDFMPGQKENIDISLNKTTLGLSIIIHSNSIPLDIEKIKSFSLIDKENIVKHNASGLGSLLINKFADSVTYLNKGREGQFIYIEKNIPSTAVSNTEVFENPANNAIIQKTDFSFYVRRLKPEESLFISQLAYYAYRISYIYDKIYYPEFVKKLNQEGEMLSVVAVNKENEEIIGHVAAINHEISNLPEMAVAFVNPRYRGGGCLQQSSEYLIDLLKHKKLRGLIVHAVTTHPYSQKAALKLNLRETAVYISRLTPLLMNEIKEEKLNRESLILMFMPFQTEEIKDIYAPPHHAKMISEIYKNAGLSLHTIAHDKKPSYVHEEAVIEVSTDNYGCSYIIVKQYGSNIISLINKTLKSLCLNRTESIYLYLPIETPEIINCCTDVEKAGFFFGGIIQTSAYQDYLMLQYLNNQIYNYDTIQVFSDFAQKLVTYIRQHDPNQNL